jgi:phosphoribosylaminoimidazolecarboxamide formyltransferase/IMP cyclohydrolase
MTQANESGLRKIKRALISVSDKSGIIEFARALRDFGVEIISTGGTAKILREAGIDVRDVSDVTGFPEMMDGRVKTLHPRIHGALLALRNNAEHVAAMQAHGIEPIDMVVVNLYPFEQTIKRKGVTFEEAIEQIDIGGPAMIRSAAKNWEDLAVITSTDDYHAIVAELNDHSGAVTRSTRRRLAEKAFMSTATYDATIFAYLKSLDQKQFAKGSIVFGSIGSSAGSRTNADVPEFSIETFSGSLPSSAEWKISKIANLRYGENPHQMAGLYQTASHHGVANAQLLSGKEMSFNNYVDADAAWQLVCDFEENACAIIKHTNPAGVGIGDSPEQAYRKALATDPVSAFGGIVAFNHPVDEAAARAVIEIFTEVIIAPDYAETALAVLSTKKNLRVLRATATRAEGVEYKQISGGMLVQTKDTHKLKREDLKFVTTRQPKEEETRALLFAWTVCKHTKSNAIIYAREDQTVGVGAGQMSRVDSVKLGAMRALLPLEGSVLASDAFFPFRDGIDEAAKHGISAVIQPGGSVRDEEVIAAANEHGLAMVFTGVRHFKH